MKRDRQFMSDYAGGVAAITAALTLATGHPFVAAGAAGVATGAIGVRYVRAPRSRLGRAERDRLIAFVRADRANGEGDLPAGVSAASGIRLRDFVARESLYVEPSVDVVKGDLSLGELLPSRVAAVLRQRKRVLLLGEPGVGKTLTCRLVHHTLATGYIRDPSNAPLPLHVRLGDLREAFDTADGLADVTDNSLIAATLHVVVGLSETLPVHRLQMLLDQRSVVLILDGLDELPGERGAMNDALPRKLEQMLRLPLLLSSRSAFFDLYVDDAREDEFDTILSVREIEFATNGKKFVQQYCARFGLTSADRLIAMIEDSETFRDVVSRPLMLFMATDVLAPAIARGDMEAVRSGYGAWSGAQVYQMYIDKWLALERGKGARVPAEDMQDLCEAVAWAIFIAAYEGGRPFGQFENVRDLVISRENLHDVVTEWCSRQHADVREVFEEARTKSFLIRSDGVDRYRFAHKSFFEFFAARHVVTAFARKSFTVDAAVDALSRPLPDEVINFIRRLLERMHADSAPDSAAVRRTMFAVLDATVGATDGHHLMARQQAANLLPLVLRDSPKGIARLRAFHAAELHPFVRRAVAVGFALHLDDGSLIDILVSELDTDPDALAFHMGYNRIYYGDQRPDGDDWRDDGGARCSGFFRATLRQLGIEAYRFIWPMAAYTARALLTDPARLAHLEEHTDLETAGRMLRHFGRVHQARGGAIGVQAGALLVALDALRL